MILYFYNEVCVLEISGFNLAITQKIFEEIIDIDVQKGELQNVESFAVSITFLPPLSPPPPLPLFFLSLSFFFSLSPPSLSLRITRGGSSHKLVKRNYR